MAYDEQNQDLGFYESQGRLTKPPLKERLSLGLKSAGKRAWSGGIKAYEGYGKVIKGTREAQNAFNLARNDITRVNKQYGIGFNATERKPHKRKVRHHRHKNEFRSPTVINIYPTGYGKPTNPRPRHIKRKHPRPRRESNALANPMNNFRWNL